MDRRDLLKLAGSAALLFVFTRPDVLRGPARGQKEAYTNLGLILEQQQKFKIELQEYLTVGPSGPLPGEKPMKWPTESCPSDCRGLHLEACSSFACLDFAPAQPVRFRYGCKAIRHGDAYDVTCAAAGDLDGDGKISLLVVGTSTSGQLVAAVPALGIEIPPTRCSTVARVPSEVVYDCTPGVL